MKICIIFQHYTGYLESKCSPETSSERVLITKGTSLVTVSIRNISKAEAELKKPKSRVSIYGTIFRTWDFGWLGVYFHFGRCCFKQPAPQSLNSISVMVSVVIRCESLLRSGSFLYSSCCFLKTV